MAQIVYLANNYPVGTELTDLEFTKVSGTSSYIQEISAGRNYFQGQGTFTTGIYEKDFSSTTEIELLYLVNLTISELGRTEGYRFTAGVADALTFFYRRDDLDAEVQNNFPTATFDSYTYTPPDTALPSITKAFAMRIYYNQTTRVLKARVWGAAVDSLETDEPAVWHHDGIVSAGDATACLAEIRTLAVMDGITPVEIGGDFTSLSIGTDGDAATFPSLTQTVTTPSAPVVSNITDTTADVSWT